MPQGKDCTPPDPCGRLQESLAEQLEEGYRQALWLPARGRLQPQAALGGVAVMSTLGGETVVFNGTFPAGTHTFTANYTNGARSYRAASCAYAAPPTTVTCVTAPGYGAGFTWTLFVDGRTVPALLQAAPRGHNLLRGAAPFFRPDPWGAPACLASWLRATPSVRVHT